jgi:hypothetical protein
MEKKEREMEESAPRTENGELESSEEETTREKIGIV